MAVVFIRCQRPSAAATRGRIPGGGSEEEVRGVPVDEAGQHGAAGDCTDVRPEPAADQVHRLRADAQLHGAAARPALQAGRPDEPDSHPAAACHGPRGNGRTGSAFDKRA